MRIEDLSLTAIDGMRHLVASEDIVSAAAFAARQGFRDATCYRFVSALVMTDMLRDPIQWGAVLRQIGKLKIAEEIAAIKADRVVTGDIE